MVYVVLGDASRDRPRFSTACLLALTMATLIYKAYRTYVHGDILVSAAICALGSCTSIYDMITSPALDQMLIFISKYLILQVRHPEQKMFLMTRIRESNDDDDQNNQLKLEKTTEEETDGVTVQVELSSGSAKGNSE